MTKDVVHDPQLPPSIILTEDEQTEMMKTSQILKCGFF